MKRKRSKTTAALLLTGLVFIVAACGDKQAAPPEGTAGSDKPAVAAPGGAGTDPNPTQSPKVPELTGSPNPPKTTDPAPSTGNGTGTGTGTGTDKPGGNNAAGDKSSAGNGDPKAVQVVAKPADVAVLVNKTYRLPDNYKPTDLVEPDIPFIFKEKSDKRLMRKEAAGALEKLVAAAKKDSISLAGVSGFRTQATQKTLFDNYVKKDGEEAARKYSAVPGHSEHQTGLAMDISGSDGKCAASDCFADTKEAKWLAKNAAEHGFIIRYPKGKESITGYQYEPWHLRYVGTKIAKDIADKGITLEEYMQSANAVQAAK
ncbi:M15 family metallopeptidase [Paenibacillus sp. GYB004]|uniref:M15 family metallopeptidase n=1 Tax=Paenibacillus sp. GYB004 TaxID=2994393 RepID=UPI002F965260